MRAYLPHYRVERPSDLAQALEFLAQKPGHFRPLAGGTDLMVLLNAGRLPPGDFLDLSRCQELDGIQVEPEQVRLGALVRYAQVLAHPLLQQEFPNLVAAAQVTGAAAIQNRGTLGGNVANASPAADTPPALLSYQAEIELISQRGVRRLDYAEFHLDYKRTALAADELISAIIVPRCPEPQFHYYRKVGPRQAQAISKVCLAASGGASLRLGLGAVAPIPLACNALREWLAQLQTPSLDARAQELLQQSIRPIDDVRSNQAYRRRVSQNLLEQMWQTYRAWSP